MTLVEPVRLYQAGDILEGTLPVLTGFNVLLDAIDVDGSYCTADDPSIDDASGPSPRRISRTSRLRQQTAEQRYFRQLCIQRRSVSALVFEMHRCNFLYKADLTPFYQNRQCNEYGKLSLLGITFIFASRDSGVAGNGKLCLFPNGTQSEDAPLLNPLFLANCPFLTSVGATQVSPGSAVFNPESTAQRTALRR
ncbi:hypothetical protein DFH08DRAFT_857241 [Mycena albidolilacea]|uniref:Uncharacterized protein n=1 Tax=Mycena albidolilacea TaxID=1033008 RepID=A0AAD7AAR7_9AGAR|nr:hypothetical protein DFH08DRAFT_857241 [Mycena albidolilacea]